MRLIAYYLPQFHAIRENDQWWGEGFTEWNSVRSAKALFPGHEQPVEPGELGYYTLLDPAIRERQAQLAREAGVEGFCYWHYWFSGHELLEKPLQQVLESGQPDFPFCIGWANESWKAKIWSDSSGQQDTTLIEQTYPIGDDERHFARILPLLLDKRYITVDSKPLLLIYRPFQLPHAREFIDTWNKMAKQAGLKGIYFVGHTLYSTEAKAILEMGFDAVNIVRIGDCKRSKRLMLSHPLALLYFGLHRRPLVYPYKDALAVLNGDEEKQENIFPSLLPRWDHTPRSQVNGFVLHRSTPELFYEQVKRVIALIGHKEPEHQIVFLKSWNEWGEGNYIEPDQQFSNRYLEELAKALQSDL